MKPNWTGPSGISGDDGNFQAASCTSAPLIKGSHCEKNSGTFNTARGSRGAGTGGAGAGSKALHSELWGQAGLNLGFVT